VRVVERHALPLVRIEIVVKSGSAADRDKPGLGAVAGELLKAGGAGKWNGRALLDTAESLGSDLDVTTDRDSTRITMAVPADRFADAMDVVGAVAVKPRFDPAEFQKLKTREQGRVASLSRTSAAWVASMVLYRKLFELPTGVHPYSRYDATPRDVDAIKLEDCRAWHKREVTAKNVMLVVTGDVTPALAASEAKRVLGSLGGEAPEAPDFATPFPPKALSIYLVDRPASPQAEVYLAVLGPERKSPEWPAMRTANQVLGGGVAGRLFLDVREKRSLAYRTRSSAESLAHGPVPIVLSAGTQTAKAGLAVGALLEHLETLGKAAPSEQEIEIATKYLSDVFLVGVDTVASISNMVGDLAVFGLPGDYYDTYRAAVRNVTGPVVLDFTRRTFQTSRGLVVVAGDASRLAGPLSHFATVEVVDAENGFVKKSTKPHDPTAPIELPRIDGT
jgi:zinc protease